MMRLMESMRTLPCPTQCSESSHIHRRVDAAGRLPVQLSSLAHTTPAAHTPTERRCRSCVLLQAYFMSLRTAADMHDSFVGLPRRKLA